MRLKADVASNGDHESNQVLSHNEGVALPELTGLRDENDSPWKTPIRKKKSS